MKEKIAIALDVSSRQDALRLVEDLHDLAGMFKVGSQLYMAAGPEIIREIIETGGKVFLDLKFHDIPNTVTQAAIEAAQMGVSMMTIHASGGRAMMEATANALRDKFGEQRPTIVAVTVLTSLDGPGLSELGIGEALSDHVLRLTMLADDCGIDGVVCSPHEVGLVRNFVSRKFKIVVPGIRLPSQGLNDQQRAATPREAISAGADCIVVGRAVTGEADPRAALERLTASISGVAG
jgi:orotidine-5'-phosphate decarboxylase